MIKKLFIILMLCITAQADTTNKPMLGEYVDWFDPLAPLAGWFFNEGSGNTIYDLSGNGNTGTFGAGAASPTWVAGKFGSALSFDGGDIINVAHSSELEPSLITIVMWVNPDDTAGLRQLISKGDNLGYRARLEDGTNLVRFYDRGATNFLTSTIAVSVGRWTQVVLVGGPSALSIYLDGQLNISGAAAYGGPTPGSILTIGDDNGGLAGDIPITGDIDSVSIYNRDLTASEIAKLYANPFCFMVEDLPVELVYVEAAPAPASQVISIQMSMLLMLLVPSFLLVRVIRKWK